MNSTDTTTLHKTFIKFMQKRQWALALFISLGFSFAGYTQTISIGSPTNGLEGSTFVSYIISLDNGAINTTGSNITGTISFLGTATAGVDYNPVTSFSIPNGVGSALVALIVLDDADIECDETVVATISNVSSGVTVNGASSTALIIDDECTQLQMSIDSLASGAEGGANVSFVVSLDFGTTNFTGAPIVGDISYSGTASGIDDYLSGPTTFTILDGENSDTIILTVIDDICVEFSESVIATISNPSVGLVNVDADTAYILDNDAGATLISIGSPVNGEEGQNNVSFIIAIDGGLTNCTGGPITGSVIFSGTATADTDFTNVSTFSIPDGASFVTFTLPVIDDLLDECDETVIATISNPNIGAIGVAIDSAIIVDNECMTTNVDILSTIGLNVYPNPTSSVLHLTSEKQMTHYSILDINSRVLSSSEVHAKEFSVDTYSLSSGVYFIQLTLEDGRIVQQKFSKE
ncbi:MAG: Calx-beta domain-containing protein [Crocinitomicaceae bacterium]